MGKLKKIICENKILFITFIICFILILVECTFLFTDNKKSKENYTSNTKKTSVKDLSEEKKKILGISSNNNESNSNITTEKIISNKNEQIKKEISNSNVNKNYQEYEKLSEEEKNKQEVIPSKEKVDLEVLDKIDDNKGDTLPTKFDLNDVIKLNYEDQGTYGLCWNFASTKVFETYLALNEKKQYNLSEIAVDYLGSEHLYDSHKLHSGANFENYNDVVKKLGGLIEQNYMNSDYYHDYTEEEYLNIFNLPRVSIENYEVVYFPTLYSFNNKLQNTDFEDVTEEDLIKYRNAMKKHIMNNSALYFVVHAFTTSAGPSYLKGNLPEGEYAKLNWQNAFYCEYDDCYDNYGSNTRHAMAIIGWDDNFDRRVFRRIDENGNVTIPKHDGAFLVANSWSNEKTYYYISYDDTELYSEIVGIKKVDDSDFSKMLNLNIISEKIRGVLLKDFSDKIISKNGIDYISYENLDNILYLNLNNLNLTNDDIKSLIYFKNLNILDIKNNNISSLDTLASLKNLTMLDADNNNISDITVLSNFSKLNSLSLANNQITDISPIKSLSELKFINLSNNKIINYENTFSNLEYLSLLSLDNCDINNLYLNSNISYTSLNLSNNPNLKLMNKINVFIIELNNNNLNNLDILTNFNEEELNSLSVNNNDIKDISALTKYKKIVSLDLSNNKNIESYEPLKILFKRENTSIQNALDNINKNMLNSIIKKYTDDDKNEEDDSSEDEVQDDDFELYPTYKSLNLSNCNISDLSMFDDFDLSFLDLSNNNITSIDELKLEDLIDLNLSNNKLENADLTNLFNSNIENLYLNNTGLTSLKIDKNIKKDFIATLDLSNNDITDISLLNNIKNIDILSLENNKNFSNYNLTNEILFLNLSNTAVDDNIMDKIELKENGLANLSSNRNIKNIPELLKKTYDKAITLNEELKNKYIEENEIDITYFENLQYLNKEYISMDLIINDYTLNTIPYGKYLNVYTNYDLTLNKDENEYINLINSENYGLFKYLIKNQSVLGLNNIELDKSYTKLKINNPIDSYIMINYGEQKFKLKFN